MKKKKIHLFHPVISLTPACNWQLRDREFKAVDYIRGVTCKKCIDIINSRAFHVKVDQ